MAMKNLQKKRRKMALRPFLGAMLMASGLFQLAIPAFGITSGGQQIDNTATATYDDQDPNTPPINATSNTVTITVAEVAGITVVPAGVVDLNGGSINTGDTVGYEYTITNVGNDPTEFFLPGANGITIPTLLTSGPNAGNPNATVDPTLGVEVVAVNGTALTAPFPAIGATGANTNALGLANGGVFNPGESVTVRVNVQIDETVATAPITVQYGDTAPNDNSAPTQNQPLTANPGFDVTTVDNDANLNDVPGVPANGIREAAAVQTEQLNTVVNDLALARLQKIFSNVTANDPTTAVDDVITYNLNLEVLATDPSGTFTPAPLTGTDVQVGGVVQNAILVSDVIPAGTVYDPTNDGAFGAPTGWTRVYATEDPATFTPTVVNNNIAGAVNWQIGLPPVNTITRVGFVYDINTAAVPAVNPIAPGDPTLPLLFQFEVITNGLNPTGGEVNNIAQVFGETLDPNGDGEQGLGVIVYDESGDQDPNNFQGSVPPDPAGTAYDPVANTGIANPAADGVDTNNNNTGVGPQGEDNQVTITATPVVVGGIFNGPNGLPDALGPTNDNDDFTNLSTSDNPANNAAPFNPDPVTFTNTVQNPATNTAALDNVTLRPLSPTEALAAQPGTIQGANGDIPTNTTVTIEFDLNGNNIIDLGESVVYTYNGATFTSPDPDLNIGSIPIGETRNYNIIVDLPPPPDGTNQNVGVPVPIVAFPENTPASGFDPAADTTNNITIDRLYTGYVQLLKEARLLDTDGVTQLEAFSQDPGTDWTAAPQPGQIIEYRVTYTNISETPAGNSITLNADNLVITEDGTIGGAGGNNWALDNDTNGEIDTSNVVGSVTATAGTTTPVANDPATDISGVTVGSDTTVYTNSVGTVLPAGTGNLRFQRLINNSATPAN